MDGRPTPDSEVTGIYPGMIWTILCVTESVGAPLDDHWVSLVYVLRCRNCQLCVSDPMLAPSYHAHSFFVFSS